MNHLKNLRNPLKKIAIISANVNAGQPKPGVELGPKYIKTERLYTNLKNLGYELIDHGEIWDVKVDKDVTYFKNKNFLSILKTNKKISEAVSSAIKDNYIPLVLGGDHSLTIGSIHGITSSIKEPVGVIWIDAHGDLNLPQTSPSGNVHGQPVSFNLKELADYIPKLPCPEESSWLVPHLSVRHLVYIGLRDLDPDEIYLLKKFNILAYSMSDIANLGLETVLKGVLSHLTVNGKLMPLHVSVDIDSLDPWFAPATGTPVLGGLTLLELMKIGNRIHNTGMLRALDLVEVNPKLSANEDECQRTVFSAINTILSFFGYTTSGTLNKDFKVKVYLD